MVIILVPGALTMAFTLILTISKMITLIMIMLKVITLIMIILKVISYFAMVGAREGKKDSAKVRDRQLS